MMKAARVLTQVRDAIGHLNPHEVRQDANLPFTIQLFAATPEAYRDLERYFIPAQGLSAARRSESEFLIRQGDSGSDGTIIRVFDEGATRHSPGFVFRRSDPDRVVSDILESLPKLRLALAAKVCPFREPVSKNVIWSVSKENALFSIATAVPYVVPFLSLPWVVGEFASDTAFLTANQIRMSFMLAAANNRSIGYRQQRTEIASLFAGAFGWRALARELAGKIPMGGGLIPKAAIAFAGTYVVGASLERYYRVGYGYTAVERREMYHEMLQRGKEVARSLIRTNGGASRV